MQKKWRLSEGHKQLIILSSRDVCRLTSLAVHTRGWLVIRHAYSTSCWNGMAGDMIPCQIGPPAQQATLNSAAVGV